MIDRRKFFTQAGSIMSLPFLWAALDASAAETPPPSGASWTFEEFESNCIDLGHYDRKTRRLTVRFVNKNRTRFYRYSHVPPEVWDKMRKLNESGGVGGYLVETIVQHPDAFPFEELTIPDFKIALKGKKTGLRNNPSKKTGKSEVVQPY